MRKHAQIRHCILLNTVVSSIFSGEEERCYLQCANHFSLFSVQLFVLSEEDWKRPGANVLRHAMRFYFQTCVFIRFIRDYCAKVPSHKVVPRHDFLQKVLNPCILQHMSDYCAMWPLHVGSATPGTFSHKCFLIHAFSIRFALQFVLHLSFVR